ncbi:hypothetical protein PFICI_01051 [Pestalotiopsis fici W106-1]|uniref:Uncharacterized protein n=1 Tax=Pestalotiopsis fici (strain W106-1 / CGMCC3.15140) TaxID=1229662 RepID=W3XMH1_PESFW|nr:uncharacterized protein PFICI_01051 [Pestalotiopsis fici W106-1]ETS87223.1 hypothetical protein PFICI_01051 [Pestalotiopsis fici W106-1]
MNAQRTAIHESRLTKSPLPIPEQDDNHDLLTQLDTAHIDTLQVQSPTTTLQYSDPSRIAVLLLNAVAILSEDRFLARVGLSASSHDPAFGAGPGGDQSFKFKLMNMIASVRMLTRGT